MKNQNEHSAIRTTASREPIAIVGVSCRFPEAPDLKGFWELLLNGRDTVTEIPAERWSLDHYFDPDPAASRKTHQRHGALLKNIHDFDPLFFAISPAEATDMNPSQKLMLELVWEAIENSSMPLKKVQGRKIGVYVGNIWSDYEHWRKQKNAEITSHSAIGQSSNVIANRVSFFFGFTGPSLVVDTGCSSSLVALHIACQSLWDSSTEMAFVGGTNHLLDPDQYVLLSKFGGLSAKGKCSTFDADADGFVRGEGGGVIMLKKLSQAEKDGDRIYAIIRGSAMNNNGFNVNLPATSISGQKQMLEDAYEHSGIEPGEVHYIEAHGTGTKLGDPTETKALGEFFSTGRKGTNLHIGSVKTNIGHLEAAAGIAGLIKVVLAMQHRTLPPSINYNTPNPDIPFNELKLQVQSKAGAWPTHNGETLKAGINSFGWGGTNAHTVLEEYRPLNPGKKKTAPAANRYCLPVSAKSSQAVKDYVKAYISLLTTAAEEDLKNICAAAAILKPAFDHSILFTATNKQEMLTALEDFLQDAGEVTPHKTLTAKDRVVMIFPGQGSQWLGMGKELLEKEPVFREAIEACDQAFKPYTDWSLLQQLHANAEESRLNEINVIQPALCAMQIALAKLWMSWGIEVHAVVGHSMGEVAAAHISGALNLDDAARIICTRSRLMKTVSGQGGAMAVTELSRADAEALVLRYPELSVAVNNSPKSTVLAGDQGSINKVLEELEGRSLFCRQVKVDVASHSKQMDPLKQDLHRALQGITPAAVTIPFYSTVKKKSMTGDDLLPDYWVDNLRGTVQFADILEQLMNDGHTVFIEASPHPVLTNAVKECAEHFHANAITIASLFREKPEQLSIYKNLGELYTNGFDINWERYYHTDRAPDVTLPSYPFQRERYEAEDKSAELDKRKNNSRFPLLGNAILLAGAQNTYFWETSISLGSFTYLQDHQVNDTPVLPGAAYAEMLLEASSEVYPGKMPVITNLRFIRSITLGANETHTLQLKLQQDDRSCMCQFFTKQVQENGKITWELLAEATLKASNWYPQAPVTINRPAGERITDSASYYKALRSLGLQYGPLFQGVKELIKNEATPMQVHFSIAASERITQTADRYRIHPALLDACLQPLFHSVVETTTSRGARTTFLTNIGEIHVMGAVNGTRDLYGVATIHPLKKDDRRGFITVEADIIIYNYNVPVLTIQSVKAKIIDTSIVEQRRERLKNWLYQVSWEKQKGIATHAMTDAGTWVVMGDPYGISDILVERMTLQQVPVIHVTPGSGFLLNGRNRYTMNYSSRYDYNLLVQELYRNPGRKIAGIIHIASMSYTWQDPHLTADVLEAAQLYGSMSFMHLYQELAALDLPEAPRLVIVTNGIQAVGDEHDIAQSVHSPLWGLAKVMFNELAEYKCRYIDLSANPTIEELDQLVATVQTGELPENELAFRGEDQYLPRLVVYKEEVVPQEKHKQFSADGTYLVTGFRGLGFVFIEWMISQGARNFALVSRSGEATTDVREKITILESQGYQFDVFHADAGNYDELKTVINTIDATMPALKGVIHAAGIMEPKTLIDLEPSDFLRILHPKVRGAWNLHLLTRNRPLDCFIMFSSASTLIGLDGQGSYVAANAFLDTLAHARRRMGLTSMSINWGVIKDVGMVANEEDLKKYARAEGFEDVSMHDAMEVFNDIFDSDHTQIGIVKLNPEVMANHYPELGESPYFKGLLAKEVTTEKKENSFIDSFQELNAEEKIPALEQLITQHVATIVKTAAARLKPNMTFKGLGIDSLMAIQLRNLLEKALNLKLSVAMFWSHPSIQEYAAFLNKMLSDHPAEKHAPAEPVTVNNANWFVIPKANPAATQRVFCFHDAGGSTSLYHSWGELLGEQVELVAVELPGRGKRMNEAPYTDIASLLHGIKPALLPLLDKPFMFFGHSMGGLVAFEVIRELQRGQHPLPTKLIMSSMPGLTTYTRREVDPTRPEEELVAMFPHLDKNVIGDEELQHLLVTRLRADLVLLNNYQYTPQETRMNIPFVALHGIDDVRVRREQVEKWQEETASTCKVITRPGGHSFIDQDGPFLTSLILEEMQVAVTV